MIRMPKFRSMVQHRMLINYRVDADVARTLVPEGMRPQLVNGYAVAGICHIVQSRLRPSWLAAPVGMGVEGTAHRISIEWDDETGTHAGVYIFERHTSSPFANLFGGFFAPGVHNRARITSAIGGEVMKLDLEAGQFSAHAEVVVADSFSSALFGDDLSVASNFFREGSVGWSPDRRGTLESVQIDTGAWTVVPGAARTIRSHYYDALPTAVLDHVFVLRDVEFHWSKPAYAAPSAAAFV